MSRADCEDLVLRAVTQAILRDGSSGGCCRMAIITKVQLYVQTCLLGCFCRKGLFEILVLLRKVMTPKTA